MDKEAFILDSAEKPAWLEYPRSFCRLVDQGITNLTPWHLLEGREALEKYMALGKRYPTRKLFPFAYRQDNDDVACWSKGTGEKVFIIHDFASPGWEDGGVFDDFWSWLRSAIEEMISWD